MNDAHPANRLARERSPYLLQHARNPVDWYPWGEEAFAKAREEGKPIFLSVGYATCHWCHVMERESFEDARVAAFLNAHFVSVKVDREERPDVDRLYMAFVQAATGSGGWPMSVFLTPGLRPFTGGTYFPPEDRGGRPGFLQVLRMVAGAWEEDRARIEAQGSRVIEALSERGGKLEKPAGWDVAGHCYEQLAGAFDAARGGFGQAPKFPRPSALQFLFRHARSAGCPRAAEMAAATLDAMAAGGIHDQVGGGFHRYSVDGDWHVPHFEKMLCDQAQIAMALVDAWRADGAGRHAETARGIFGYVLREMADPGGAFHSAEDADSRAADGSMAEGAFYVWREEEVSGLFKPDDAMFVRRAFGVENGGNAPRAGDPHGEFDGLNILVRRLPLPDLAALAGVAEGRAREMLEGAKKRLLAEREKRPRPLRDDKIITAWNGLMISAFARAGAAFGEPSFVEAAERAARFFRDQGEIRRCFRGGPSPAPASAEDYAFLIQGLLDLYAAGASGGWLRWACALQEEQDRLFADPDGGYFSSPEGDPSILIRMKEEHDSAEPAAGSVAALNLMRLASLTRREAWRERASAVLAGFGKVFADYPSALPLALVAMDEMGQSPRQLVLAGAPGAAGRAALLAEAHRKDRPGLALLFADGGEDARWLSERVPELAGMRPGTQGEALAYLCEDFVCRAPVADPEELARLLGG